MMGEAQSIAAATAILRRVLLDGIPKQDVLLAQVDVTSLPPDKVNANVDRATVNVFLYRVATPRALRNSASLRVGLPGDADPRTAFSLHYLLTAYGRVDQEAGDLSHRVLGAAMHVLQNSAVITEGALDAMLPVHPGLTAAQAMKVVPVETSLEEMATLWSMFHTSYRLSAVYEIQMTGSKDGSRPAPDSDATGLRSHEKFSAALQAIGLDPEASGTMTQLKAELDAADSATRLSALFVGGSGQSVQRVAQLLAGESQRPLHRVDLSTLSDTYIGETEKNLSRVFDEAEAAGAILLFDEADALFGTRSEVRDSHDRYANIEVSYLLHRLGAFPGLVVIGTARRANIDQAFVRRLRFIVEFPPTARE